MEDEGFEEHYRNRDVIVPRAFIGQPILIRIVNAGVGLHSAHIHGNHVFVTAVNNVVQSNVIFVDTFSIQPPESQFQGSVPAPGASQASPVLTGGSRVDWLLPVICPPDIPGEGLLTVRAAQELALGPADGLLTPASPFEYPMHCHTEMSQTMLGGNYPMGLVTHWEILGDRDEHGHLVPFPGVEH
jgi:hypothetical protein